MTRQGRNGWLSAEALAETGIAGAFRQVNAGNLSYISPLVNRVYAVGRSKAKRQPTSRRVYVGLKRPDLRATPAGNADADTGSTRRSGLFSPTSTVPTSGTFRLWYESIKLSLGTGVPVALIRAHPSSCPVHEEQPSLVSRPAQSHPSCAPARIGAGSVRCCQFNKFP
jgi:hypothetical protein